MIAVIQISKARLAQLNEYLSSGPHDDGDGIIEQFTVEFPDGFFADIKVCAGGDGCQPYIDPVLFDDGGAEYDTLDAGRATLEGKFEFAGDHTVVVAEGSW